jgi:hypothetical protein
VLTTWVYSSNQESKKQAGQLREGYMLKAGGEYMLVYEEYCETPLIYRAINDAVQ